MTPPFRALKPRRASESNELLFSRALHLEARTAVLIINSVERVEIPPRITNTDVILFIPKHRLYRRKLDKKTGKVGVWARQILPGREQFTNR
jgi:hypothetical protein